MNEALQESELTSKAGHHAEGTGNSAVRQLPHLHVLRLGHEAHEVPGIARGKGGQRQSRVALLSAPAKRV